MTRPLHPETELPLIFGEHAGSGLGLWLAGELNDMRSQTEANSLGQLVNDLKTMIESARNKRHVSNWQRIWQKLNAEFVGVKLSAYLMPPRRIVRRLRNPDNPDLRAGKPLSVMREEEKGLAFFWGPDLSGAPEGDSQYIKAVIFDLGSKDLLWRVRQCRYCKEWIYATRGNKEHCDDSCRKLRYKKTPEGQAKNAEYVRKHRTQPAFLRDREGRKRPYKKKK